ncbi:PD-(D/E)XK nuclease-like domain-containing protein [Enterococcus sp. BWR-S5]|uniref:PD-(D/E)XK nuclease-like domain-containing protein n=1 Tax=Enterococcus sp. BWR-S5 TaxID=2787714 RepID=UPI001924408F|nr:PD-(D/E)XK nuclease-like domain-containing protein [Enterococcus sp. BWR-S5]MBL1225401.1 PD-(D/E)XK nuclease-like domain-containing protein [Enterococcus sp. BWR-S5]
MDATEQNYYSNELDWQYMSVSQFKKFDKCEAKAAAELNGTFREDNTEAFLVGNYVHSAFESNAAHEDFLTRHQEEMLTKKGTLRAPFILAEKMVERINEDDFFHELYQGEKEIIITGELFGAVWKGKIDCLNIDQGYFVDLKTTREIERKLWSTRDNNWGSFVEEYGYVLQMAIYRELLQQKYGKEFTPYIFAVSKQNPPNIEAINFDQEIFARELEYVEEKLPRFLRVKNGEAEPSACGTCEYCRANKKIIGFKNVLDLIERR